MRFMPLLNYLPTLNGVIANALAREAVYPFYASLKLTSRCHFGCPFCNVKKFPTPDLSTDAIKTILDNLSRSSVLMTSFEGGEPLLRNDIGELLRYARSCKFYLLFTTSVKNITDYPLKEYAPLIDFLHVSIDEGHNNLELFDALPRLTALPTQVSVQSVVTRSTMDALEEKVKCCAAAGANIVIIPAARMEAADDHFPEIAVLEEKVNGLRKRYPDTIHTPSGYFKAYRKGRCSSASVIIAPDGRLYYPCNILNIKGPALQETDLMTWLKSAEARALRSKMGACAKNCGWYQYYSIGAYTSVASVWQALRPMLTQGRRR
jgi:MoaA/NifB/PqqE/SkfB family radical SAM enzyme